MKIIIKFIIFIFFVQFSFCRQKPVPDDYFIYTGYNKITFLKLSENDRYLLYFVKGFDKLSFSPIEVAFVYDIMTKETVQLKFPKMELCCAKFTEDSSRIIITGKGGIMRIYETGNLDSFQEVMFPLEENNLVLSISYHKKGLLGVMAKRDLLDSGNFWIYDLSAKKIIKNIPWDEKNEIFSNFQIFEDRIGTRSYEKLKFINFNGKLLEEESYYNYLFIPEIISNSDYMILYTGDDGNLLFWSREKGKFTKAHIDKKICGHKIINSEAVFSTFSATDSQILFLDLETGQFKESIQLKKEIPCYRQEFASDKSFWIRNDGYNLKIEVLRK